MATFKLMGNEFTTNGNLPKVGEQAPSFTLTKTDLDALNLEELKGKRVVLNIFPSLDTEVCAMSVRKFNEEASTLDNTVVVCASRDLPFAHKRFCGAEGIENVTSASDYKTGAFGKDFGVHITSGPLEGLLARSVVVVDENGKVIYTELVPETTDEPNYEAAIASLS